MKLMATNPDPNKMTEAELAEYYYQNRHDLAGEEVPSRKPDNIKSNRLDNPIEAAIDAARNVIDNSDKGITIWSSLEVIDDALSDAIRAAAPILIREGRELAAKNIEQHSLDHTYPPKLHWLPAAFARIARGGEDE